MYQVGTGEVPSTSSYRDVLVYQLLFVLHSLPLHTTLLLTHSENLHTLSSP